MLIKVNLKGQALLNTPLLNKGMAFSEEERTLFGLHGLLPYHVATIEEQLARRYENFRKQGSSLAKYLFLSALQNNNEVLFYRLVSEHITEMLPLIYTPTVGDASLSFSAIYTQRRGLYLSYPHRDKIEELVNNLPNQQVDVIVITDGERILGLGDLGANGMAISVGKVALYTIFGGIYPGRALPLFVDVGTNNKELIEDPLYLGWRHKRITGKKYDQFIDQCIQAIKKRFPHVLLQWEDFAKEHAEPLLKHYQDAICSFNDDIQGTAAVVLSALLSAVALKKERLKEQRILLFGAGSAGIGISRYLLKAMQEEGLSEKEALKAFYLVDRDGLIHTELESVSPEQQPFARDFKEINKWQIGEKIPLLDLVKQVKPTVLIGVSAQKNAFTQEVVEAMAEHAPRPIIFPLSNPIDKSEAEPKDLVAWTKGQAIIATGSPFPPVEHRGEVHLISQCNNVYIFPGIGLGCIASGATRVTDRMFLTAAKTLTQFAPSAKHPLDPLFPRLEELPQISQEIAYQVALVAQEEGVAPKSSREKTLQKIRDTFWHPHYPSYELEI